MKLIASVANAKLSVVSTSGEKLVDVSYDNYALEVDVANIINEGSVLVALINAAKQKIAEIDNAASIASTERQAKWRAAHAAASAADSE